MLNGDKSDKEDSSDGCEFVAAT